MDETPPPGAIERVLGWPLLAVAAFVAFIHGAWWLAADTVVVNGELFDGDSYAHLLRVIRLFETGGWFDNSLPRANAPYGGSLHWTRLFDALLIALSAPLVPALGFGKALYWAGVAVGPILHVAAAVALVWAALPVLGRANAHFAGVLTAAQFGILGYATTGHADHHMLFGLLTILALGFAVRALIVSTGHRRAAFFAGGFLALALWVGPEALIFLALCLLAVGVAWLSGEQGGAGKNVHITLGLTLGLALVLLIERGPAGYVDVEYDRLSIVHLTLAALLGVFWSAVGAASRFWSGRHGAFRRLLAALAGAGAIAWAMWLLYPKVLLGPLGQFDPALIYIFDDISEFGPIEDVPRLLLYLGGGVFAAPWVVWRAKEEWNGPRRWPWLLIAGGVFVYLAFAVNWARGSLYAGIFIAVVVADLVGRAEEIVATRLAGTARVLALTAAAAFLAAGPLAAGAGGLYAKMNSGEGKRAGGGSCFLQAMTNYLNGPPWSGRSRTVLASPNFGPEILYRTNHKVIGTLHHRNGVGILDSVRILGGADEAVVLRLVRRRGIELILICLNSGSGGYIRGRADKRILYRRLERGEPPAWLEEIAIPRDLGQAFRLFEVLAPPASGE